MLLIFGLVRCIAKPSLIKVSRVSLHCSDMLNSKFSKNFAKSLFPDMGVYCGSIIFLLKAKAKMFSKFHKN